MLKFNIYLRIAFMKSSQIGFKKLEFNGFFYRYWLGLRETHAKLHCCSRNYNMCGVCAIKKMHFETEKYLRATDDY